MTRSVAWLDADTVAHRAAGSVGGRPRAVMLIDAGLASHPIVADGSLWLRENGFRVEQASVPTAPGAAGVGAVMNLVDGADLVLAIGGGSVLDAAKLGTLAVGHDRFVGCLTVPQRGGIVLAPAGTVRVAPLVAIPTTLGTGSESSRVAVLTDANARRLVMGAGLRPEAKVLDPLATRGLPERLVLEGVAEVLARIVGPYVGEHDGQATTDAVAQAVAFRLVELGDAVADRPAHAPGNAELRLDIARLSSLSHSEWLARDGHPYAVKGWLLANELAFVTGVRKMTATAALWPALWDRIDGGDGRIGSAIRLRGLWSGIRRAHRRQLPAEPGPGIARLLAHWGLGAPLIASQEQVQATVRAVNRSWGAGLPMLGGLRPADVRELISAAVTTPYPGADSGRLPA
jgi:NADP-dependent alcohol dehydrogenase